MARRPDPHADVFFFFFFFTAGQRPTTSRWKLLTSGGRPPPGRPTRGSWGPESCTGPSSHRRTRPPIKRWRRRTVKTLLTAPCTAKDPPSRIATTNDQPVSILPRRGKIQCAECHNPAKTEGALQKGSGHRWGGREKVPKQSVPPPSSGRPRPHPATKDVGTGAPTTTASSRSRGRRPVPQGPPGQERGPPTPSLGDASRASSPFRER